MDSFVVSQRVDPSRVPAGQTVVHEARFYLDGVLADPAPDTILHKTVSPIEVETDLAYGTDSALTRISTGVYEALVQATSRGRWHLHWEAILNGKMAACDSFVTALPGASSTTGDPAFPYFWTPNIPGPFDLHDYEDDCGPIQFVYDARQIERQYKDTGETEPVVINGDPVAKVYPAKLSDLQRIGKILTQPTDDLRPMWLRTSFNGYSCWQFDDILGTFLQETTSVTDQPYTVIVLIKLGSVIDQECFWDSGDVDTNRNTVNGTNKVIRAGAILGAGAASALLGYSVESLVMDGTDSIYYHNGALLAEGDTGSNTTRTGLTLGAMFDGTNAMDGKIAWIGCMKGRLTAPNAERIAFRLLLDYGLDG